MHKVTIYGNDTQTDHEEGEPSRKELRSTKSGVFTPCFLSETRQNKNKSKISSNCTDFSSDSYKGLGSKNQRKREWQSFVLPEVTHIYDSLKDSKHKQIKKSSKLHHNLSEGKINLRHQRSTASIDTESKEIDSLKDVQTVKSYYEDKLKTLEHQNENLKDELYYLRAALLAQIGCPNASRTKHD